MKDYKNIDRLFQEKFREFEQTPPPEVWDNINTSLYGKPKKDRRVFALWFSGIAAGLAILFSINNPFVTTKTNYQKSSDTNAISVDVNSENTEITNTTNKEIFTTPDTNNTKQENTAEKNKTTIQRTHKTTKTRNTPSNYIVAEEIQSQKNNYVVQEVKKAKKLEAENTNLLAQKTKESNSNSININSSQPDKSELVNNSNPNNQITKQPLESLGNTVAQNDKVVSKTKSNKWILSTLAAPVMLNSFGKASSIDSQFNNNEKQGQISASYGIQLAYQVTDRLILQSGLHMVDYGYKTLDVFVAPDRYASTYSNISYDAGDDLIDIDPNSTTDFDSADQEVRLKEAKGDLTQVFGYYEIPIEAKYTIKKGDFGVNVLGGFSTLILNKNEIYVQTNEFSNKIGEASNLNNINLSGNFGVEFDYKLYKNIHFNLTPMIKVHANTFKKDTGGFDPYAIGVYSGLNFRF